MTSPTSRHLGTASSREPVTDPSESAGSITKRFWARVDMSGGRDACWPWMGSRHPDGYGQQSGVDGPDSKRTHRYALSLALGRPIRPGMFACHTCDNPPCCNPAHLFEGTPGDNVADSVRKNRRARGSATGGALLTEQQAIAIAAGWSAGESRKDLAEAFGITPIQVWRIATGRSWSHLTRPPVRQRPSVGPSERSLRIAELLAQGMTQAAVARAVGVSRQRVHQQAHRDLARRAA